MGHVSVMPEEVYELLSPALSEQESPVLWDLTWGGGGHSRLFFERMPEIRILGVDRDRSMIEKAQRECSAWIAEGRLRLLHSEFSEVRSDWKPHAILADLGVSSFQIDQPERGFSFRENGPLDMRMNDQSETSLADYLQNVEKDELVRVLREFGQERFSERIGGALFQAAREGRLPEDTQGLSNLIVKAIPAGARHSRIHASTRSFQALRIAVNNELGELDSLLQSVILELQPGGRVAIISFHSLEDRRVKRAFKERDGDGFQIVTRKPLVPTREEQTANRRSRSAKLRAIERDPVG